MDSGILDADLRVAHDITVDEMAIVPSTDERLQAYESKHPQFRQFLQKFTDPFGARVSPGVLLLRSDAPGAAVMRFQASLKSQDKAFHVEGLDQVTNRPCRERLRTHLLIGKGREKDEWHARPLAAQVSLQLDAARAGHLDIRDHA